MLDLVPVRIVLSHQAACLTGAGAGFAISGTLGTVSSTIAPFHVVDGTGTNKPARDLVTRACAVRLWVVIAITGEASCPGRAPASAARRRADPGPSTTGRAATNRAAARRFSAGPRISRPRYARRGPGYATAQKTWMAGTGTPTSAGMTDSVFAAKSLRHGRTGRAAFRPSTCSLRCLALKTWMAGTGPGHDGVANCG
jgi:hypothetical protein